MKRNKRDLYIVKDIIENLKMSQFFVDNIDIFFREASEVIYCKSRRVYSRYKPIKTFLISKTVLVFTHCSGGKFLPQLGYLYCKPAGKLAFRIKMQVTSKTRSGFNLGPPNMRAKSWSLCYCCPNGSKKLKYEDNRNTYLTGAWVTTITLLSCSLYLTVGTGSSSRSLNASTALLVVTSLGIGSYSSTKLTFLRGEPLRLSFLLRLSSNSLRAISFSSLDVYSLTCKVDYIIIIVGKLKTVTLCEN